jgi:hypothetical protein
MAPELSIRVKKLVAKLAKSFGYAPSVLCVADELTPFLRGLTKNSKFSSLEVSAFKQVTPKVLATSATNPAPTGANAQTAHPKI